MPKTGISNLATLHYITLLTFPSRGVHWLHWAFCRPQPQKHHHRDPWGEEENSELITPSHPQQQQVCTTTPDWTDKWRGRSINLLTCQCRSIKSCAYSSQESARNEEMLFNKNPSTDAKWLMLSTTFTVKDMRVASLSNKCFYPKWLK